MDIEEIPLPKGYPPFTAAEKVLREFAGLHIGRCDTGIECATSDFEIDPVDTVGENLKPDKRAPNGLRVYPLGIFCNSHGLLYIDEEGVVYYTWLRLLLPQIRLMMPLFACFWA
ncbi:MAG: SUKH-3 domain-containing protein [Candidatus Methylacidiphilales bacterium]|nr:SUKH-3 domain-containing protein [Candidatus Methylacidiphilales bacterium]